MASVELTKSLLGTVGAAIMVNEIAKHCIASRPANRFDTTPYIAPDAWVATTAYAVGAYVVANGNIYSCLVAGTSGSTAPSGAGSPIDIRNDGNCDAYMGADKVHPNTRGHTEYLGGRMARKIEAALMAI